MTRFLYSAADHGGLRLTNSPAASTRPKVLLPSLDVPIDALPEKRGPAACHVARTGLVRRNKDKSGAIEVKVTHIVLVSVWQGLPEFA